MAVCAEEHGDGVESAAESSEQMALRHFLMLIFHRAVILFILIIFMHSAIIVKHIFSSVISDHTEMFRIYFLHTFRRLSHGDTFPFPDKKWNLVKRDIYIVDALAEEFFADTSVREEFDESGGLSILIKVIFAFLLVMVLLNVFFSQGR